MGFDNAWGRRVLAETDSFDPDWYLGQYPDVALSGLDPADHYQWLGRRLGRLPCPPRHGLAGNDGLLDRAQPYDNASIGESLKRLCQWLFPESNRRGFTAERCFELVAHNFWNDESNGRVIVNPNGKLLVDFLRSFGQPAVPIKRRSLRRVPPPKSILLASFYAPSRAHAGGLRILDLYEEIRERHPSIRLTLFCSRHPDVDGDISILGDVFDETFICDPSAFSPRTFRELAQAPSNYDVVDLQFHQAGVRADAFRSFGKHLIYTPMEVLTRAKFDLIRKRAAEDEFPLDSFFALIHHGAEESKIMDSVDNTVCVSEADAQFLRQFSGTNAVSHFPTGLSRTEFADQLRASYKPLPAAKRKNRLIFAAYFGSETNLAGLEWYLREVHPKVLAGCPDYNLGVVGRGDTSKLERLGAKSVSFIGEVPRLSPVFEQSKGGLVLALHGSGFRGKINQYALCGLPSVSTSLGLTGLDYVDGEDILIADSPMAFAEKCISLLTKDKDTQRLAKAARKRAIESYAWSSIWPRIAPIYGLA